MLETLSVRNYVLIDHLDISFSDGFSVLTGETGSGKTIMLGAISLLLGGKADKNAIRKGYDSAEIAAVFSTERKEVIDWLRNRDIEIDEGEIVIRRTIKANGRSSSTINGIHVAREECRELGSLLVDISSQHEQQSLMRPEILRKMLDESSSISLDSYAKEYRAMKEAEYQLEEIKELIKKSEAESDYMHFAFNELESAGLKEGEEEELRARISVMSSFEFLRESLSVMIDDLRNATSSISDALSTIKKAERKDPSLSSISERLESMDIEGSDILLTLRDHLSSISFSEDELEEANNRLSVIQRVKKRYGGTVEEAIRRREDFRARLRITEDGEASLEKAQEEFYKARRCVLESAERISEARLRGAKVLEKRVTEHLSRLGMDKAVFSIQIERGELKADGIDTVSFLIAPNKGERLSPIQNTASGGELSRIMLALKSSIKGGGDVDTLLFDEIDAGIGGTVASAVAEELKVLSGENQVIAITHLPQIASRASSHFLVEKEEKDGRTISRIREIEGDERVKEIARLLSGETSAISLEHARALLEVQR